MWSILASLALAFGSLAVLVVYNGRWPPWARLLLLAVTMAGYVGLGWTQYRMVLRLDELRRRLEMETMMLAFIASAGFLLLLFFLHAFKLWNDTMDAVPFVLIVCYVLAQVLVRVRYRYWAP
jgi:hypothetical protein